MSAKYIKLITLTMYQQ